MFKEVVPVYPIIPSMDNAFALDSTARHNFAGPRLKGQPKAVRYGAAVAIVLLAAGLRFVLSPFLGEQALLLPFILAVLGTSIVAGPGPALFGSVVAPVLATALFMGWSLEEIAPVWWRHVAFFLVISVAVIHVMDSLQKAIAVEHAVQVAMRRFWWEAHRSQAQMRSWADGLPFLVAYLDDKQGYRFANKAHKEWLGIKPDSLIGRDAEKVWGEGYHTIRPHLAAALSGSSVDCQTELATRRGRREIRLLLQPDYGHDGTVKGLFATIIGRANEPVAPEAATAN